MSESVIRVNRICVDYDGKSILNEVSFNVKNGEIFVIVGPSGCGKSTLMRQMIGIESPSSGSVFIEEENLTESYGKRRIDILSKFGILFQSSGLISSMTIAENIALVLEKYKTLSSNSINDIIDLKLKAVGLSGAGALLPSELSGGMKKRAGIARAMTLDPSILFFDEPSSGLDPLSSAQLDKLIIELNNALGTTMVVVTHDLASIRNISHRIIMLDRSLKGIIATGSFDELKSSNNETVRKFFNREC
ncbi:MAG: ATP-binding cassette domain-containing protein [Candidatus Kapabacteria bacterium]|nr:ATP-binding cassette domain-containing protein [Candidatus Kapabacteria bacterium]